MPVIGLIERRMAHAAVGQRRGCHPRDRRWGDGVTFDARLSVAELTARSPFSAPGDSASSVEGPRDDARGVLDRRLERGDAGDGQRALRRAVVGDRP